MIPNAKKINYNISDSFEKLMGELFYTYKGYRAERRPDGNLLVVLKVMTYEEFHEWVDGIYLELDKSINRIKPYGYGQTKRPH